MYLMTQRRIFLSNAEAVGGGYLMDEERLWAGGVVPYRIDVDPWDGEPVYLDSQIQNITQALSHIMRETPCIEFR